MQKFNVKITSAIFFFGACLHLFGLENWERNPILDPEKLCNLYSGYQDIIIKNQVFREGYQRCDERYELIRPILDRYKRKFSVLDIGAMEGYFSFRIAEDYDAICTMIEGGNDPTKTKLYWYAQEKLFSLCLLNSHLNNIYYLAHKLTLSSFKKLNTLEHFDVVIAFLVLHMMAVDPSGMTTIEKLNKYLNVLLSLGNDIIIEMSVDVLPELDEHIHRVCLKHRGEYLGALPRAKIDGHPSMGKFYWFKSRANLKGKDAEGLCSETFRVFNGKYPIN